MKKTNVFLIVLAALLCAAVVYATTYKTAIVTQNKNLVQPRNNGESATVVGVYETTAGTELAPANIIEMVPIPANVTVTDVTLIADDVDNSTVLTIDVGYGGNDDYFIDGTTVGQAGGVARSAASTAHPLYFSTADTIDLTIATGTAATSPAGTLSLIVTYTGGSAR